MPRFAANLGFLFPELAFLERFGAAARAGFGAVEFASPYEHDAHDIAARLEEHGLQCILFNLPMGDKSQGDFGIACLPQRREEFRAGVARALENAHVLGCKRMNCIAGRSVAGLDPGAQRSALVGNLRHAASALGEAGLELVVEPINATDVPGFFLPRCGPAARLIEEVGAPNLGLQCDLYHVAMEGDDPLRTLEELRPVIRHVQFADAPGRHEPGTGRLDFPGLFARLDDLGYDGWTAAEYRPTKRTEDTLAWLTRSG